MINELNNIDRHKFYTHIGYACWNILPKIFLFSQLWTCIQLFDFKRFDLFEINLLELFFNYMFIRIFYTLHLVDLLLSYITKLLFYCLDVIYRFQINTFG